MDITIPVAYGELVDKLTILNIKKRKITNLEKVKKIDIELEILEEKVEVLKNINNKEFSLLFKKLYDVNLKLWEVEDNIRIHELNNEFGGMGAPQDLPEDILAGSSIGHALEKSNTTIGIVATNAKLDSKTAKRIAIMSHTGMARAIRPIHTPVDGDVIFVVSTNTFDRELTYREINEIGELGARVCSRSISRAIYEAEKLYEMQSWKDKYT